MNYYDTYYPPRQKGLNFIEKNIERRYQYGYYLSNNIINNHNINFNQTNIKKRPNSNNKIIRPGVQNQDKNSSFNKKNTIKNKKSSANKLYNYDSKVNDIIKNNVEQNENKKDNFFKTKPLYYGQNDEYKTYSNPIYNTDNFPKRLIYGGRDNNYHQNEYEKFFNPKTEIKIKNKEEKDHLLYTFNTDLTGVFPKNRDFKKYYLDSNTYINSNEKENNYYKDKINKDKDDKKDNQNYNNESNIKNNSFKTDNKNQDINYKYNTNNNYGKISYNKDINNNTKNNNENKDDINLYNKINSIIPNENKNKKKEIETILATSKDYLDEEKNPQSTEHNRPNKPKSNSVAPHKKTFSNDITLITNSLVGLNNLGSTCYMNSALQNIIHCKKLIEKLLSFKSNNYILPNLTNSFINVCYSLAKKNNSLEKNYLSTYSYSLNSFSPLNFKENFGSLHKDYRRGQHDSIEFLRTLLDDISKELNINKNISAYKELTTEGKSKIEQNQEYHNFFLSRENSIIIDTFYIQMINIFTCQCGFESYSFQKLLDIPLLLMMKKSQTDLISLIKEYLKEEEIDLSSKCEKCNKTNITHFKKIKFSMVNDIIIFSLQRFDPFYSMKSRIFVSFNEYLDLKEFCDYDLYKENKRYRLCGTINHIGDINYGHYYAYVRIGEIWYEFNDSIVKKINNMDFMNSTVCVLFYEKE